MNFKILCTIVAGTALEYFDFLLFAHFGLILTPLFFPDNDPIATSILSLGLFALGFIMRPIGGVIFGTIGDRLGRRRGLSASFIWIALPTFGICLMPTYAQIGLFAPLGLVLCRMGQGLSLGGEYINAGIFLMEHAQKTRKGLYSGILAGAGTLGSIAALGCAWLVIHSDKPDFYWRFPFFIGACVAAAGYKMRQLLKETPEFKAFANRCNFQHFAASRCWSEIFANKKSFLSVIGIGAMVGALVWTFSTYTNHYLTKVAGWTSSEAMPVTLVGCVTYIGLVPFMGYLGDKIGLKFIMSLAASCTLLAAYPLFLLLTGGYPIAAQIGFALLVSAYGATIHAVMVSLYPVSYRCRALSVGFSIGISIGGASPMIAAWLVNMTGSDLSPAYYIMAIALMGLWATSSPQPFESIKKRNFLKPADALRR